MAISAVFYIDQVETGIHICWKFLFQEIHNDASGRRRFDITLADWSCGVDDHDIQATFGSFDGYSLGHELRALVWTNHVGQRYWSILVSAPASAVAGCCRTDGRNARSVNHPAHAILARGS